MSAIRISPQHRTQQDSYFAQPRQSTEPLLPPPATSEDFDDQPTQEETWADRMGVSLSTARIIAPLSFAVNFACQTYGMTASPNMKEISDANPSAFSPQPFAIAGFFGPQQILQLLWMRELYRADGQVEQGTIRYAPWYALGNFLIGGWMLFWNSNNLKGADIPVIINTLTQTYYVFYLRNKAPSTYQSQLTNIVNITFAGIGILDIFHNTAVAWFPRVSPNTLVQALTAIAAPLTALVSPLLFGACIAYDLFGLAIGQHQLAGKIAGGGGGEGWARLLGGVGVAVAGIVGIRGFGGAQWL